MRKKLFIDIFIYLAIALFAAFCLIPMLLVASVSITDESVILKNGFSLIPEKISLYAYKMLLGQSKMLFNSYLITVFITIVGTVAAVTVTVMAAYTLTNKRVRYRNSLAFFFFFTMLFNGGIVPWYILCTKLGLKENILALIIPGLLFNPFNMFLVRNFMGGIPDSLMESAKIDGAGDFFIAFRIYFPLSIPVIAAITLFYAIGYWNDWWNAIMLISDKNLYPLQFLLLSIKSQLRMLREMSNISNEVGNIPTQSIQMATTIITIGPIVLLYPFLQRHFIKGIILGAVKG